MLWPVTHRPSSPARNATTSAMSAGSPIRPSAVERQHGLLARLGVVVTEHLGVGRSRQHRVDRDAALAKLVRGDAAEQLEGGLARCIRRHPRPDHDGVEGRDVDHPAAVAQALRCLADEHERALHVHVERGVEHLVARVGDRVAGRDAGVVHEDVQRPEQFLSAREQPHCRRRFTEISLHRVRCAARGLHPGDDSSRVVGPRPVAEYDGRAVPASRSTMALPIPREPPVTSAALSRSSVIAREYVRPIQGHSKQSRPNRDSSAARAKGWPGSARLRHI